MCVESSWIHGGEHAQDQDGGLATPDRVMVPVSLTWVGVAAALRVAGLVNVPV